MKRHNSALPPKGVWRLRQWLQESRQSVKMKTSAAERNLLAYAAEKDEQSEKPAATRPDDAIQTLDFNAAPNLAFTRPLTFSYFGRQRRCGKNWRKLYLEFVATFMKDYPTLFHDGVALYSDHVDLATKANIGLIRAPYKIPDSEFFLELNYSANDFAKRMKAILQRAGVEFENVVITYCKKDQEPTTTATNHVAKSHEPRRPAPRKEKTVQSEKPAPKRPDVAATTLDFNAAPNLAFTRPLTFSYFGRQLRCDKNWASLYLEFVATFMQDYPTLFHDGLSFSKAHVDVATKANCRSMTTPCQVPGTEFFIEINYSANAFAKRMKAIMRRADVEFENVLITYCKKDQAPTSTPTSPAAKPSAKRCQNKEYAEILAEEFPKGFRFRSLASLNKFREAYAERFGTTLDDTDQELVRNVERLCVLIGNFAYLPKQIMSDELKEKLLRYVDELFNNGKKTIDYVALYETFAEELLASSVSSAETLKDYLKRLNRPNLVLDQDFLAADPDATPDPVAEIRDALLKDWRMTTEQELFDELPHIANEKIKETLSNNDEFILNKKGEYFHESALYVDDDELEKIAVMLEDAIQENDFMTAEELYDAILRKFPEIEERNGEYTARGFQEAMNVKFNKKFPGRFDFSGPRITCGGGDLSANSYFEDYLKGRPRFTIDELEALAKGCGNASPPLNLAYKKALRVSREEFVSKSDAQFHVLETDAAIERFCTDDYLPLAAIDRFGTFPDAGFPWNCWLLQSYLTGYSRKFRLLHRGFNKDSCAGAIVKESAGIADVDALFVRALADSSATLTKEAALDFLAEQGYLARRKYARIEATLNKARALRNQRQQKES